MNVTKNQELSTLIDEVTDMIMDCYKVQRAAQVYAYESMLRQGKIDMDIEPEQLDNMDEYNMLYMNYVRQLMNMVQVNLGEPITLKVTEQTKG